MNAAVNDPGRAPAFYALDRDEDISQVSGTGRVAYAIAFPSGVLLVWDLEHRTVDYRRDIEQLRSIHGHNGSTRITPLDQPDDEPARRRAAELLAQVITPAVATLAVATVELGLDRWPSPSAAA